MKIFKCQSCGQLLHFDNRQCMNCGRRLGYLPSAATILALDPVEGGWRQPGSEVVHQFCSNSEYDACNWLIETSGPSRVCIACRHNHVIPDLGIEENLVRWRKVEAAKHHLFYTLLRFHLPIVTRLEAPQTGLAFDILAEFDGAAPHAVMTGHDDGLITLALAEADDAVREQRRVSMGEPYRTLLGHFRHEIGHYYWDRLVAGSDRLDEFRTLFGDETADYGNALATYYASGPKPNWQNDFVSAYATSHPWEDFAETWAHYLHIVDTLEMAGAYGLHVQPKLDDGALTVDADAFDPHRVETVEQLTDAWLPITLAMNSLNRCMGQPDLYPFVLAPSVIAKLGMIHALIKACAPSRQVRSGPLPGAAR